jgi:hypothetical protein
MTPIPDNAQAVTAPEGRLAWGQLLGASKLHINTKAVGFMIRTFMDDDDLSHVAYASITDLAWAANVSERTVRRHVRALRDTGWLSTTSRRGVYLLTVPVVLP